MVKILNICTLALAWIASLVVPHFQSSPGYFSILLDVAIMIILFFSILALLENQCAQIRVLKFGLLSLSLGGFLLGVIALRMGQPLIYDLWTHFGAGPMRIDGDIFLFGDLAHLTSAVSCLTTIEIGVDVCDPWHRLYNQNILVGEIFRWLQLSDTFAVGLTIFVVFVIATLSATFYLRTKSLEPYLFMLSPVVILAVDRGNELLTTSFILAGIFFLHQHTNVQQFVGAAFFGCAVVFKLWPILLVVSFLLIHWFRLRIAAKLMLIFIAIYFIANIAGFREIASASQPGSALGASFGFKLFMSSQLSHSQLLLLLLISCSITVLLIMKLNNSLEFFMGSSVGQKALPWLLPIMSTYFGVWALTESYIYRLVILLPLVLLLSKEEVSKYSWSKLMRASILVTVITSRLPITIAITSALAIYFLSVLFFVGIRVLQNQFILFKNY